MTVVSTRGGQYRVVDLGSAEDLRYVWIERVGGTERTMCSFVLFTDAAVMLRSYQDRENAERAAA
jgi:hypothetical protein